MPKKNDVLPEGWSRIQGPRPAYERRDGYVVKFDDRAKWGIRAPGHKRPFEWRPDMETAMAHVDQKWPL